MRPKNVKNVKTFLHLWLRRRRMGGEMHERDWCNVHCLTTVTSFSIVCRVQQSLHCSEYTTPAHVLSGDYHFTTWLRISYVTLASDQPSDSGRAGDILCTDWPNPEVLTYRWNYTVGRVVTLVSWRQNHRNATAAPNDVRPVEDFGARRC